MPVVVIATLVVVGLLVVALAAFLVWVVGILRSVDASLAAITSNIRRVADRTAPLNSALRDANGDLKAVAEALEGLAATATGTPPPRAS